MALGFWFFDLFPIGQESLGAIFTHMQLFDLFLGKDLGNVHGGRLWTALAAQKDYLGEFNSLLYDSGSGQKAKETRIEEEILKTWGSCHLALKSSLDYLCSAWI